MKHYAFRLIVLICSLAPFQLVAQEKAPLFKEDSTALEGIIVEKYYASENKDTTAAGLPPNAVTYRIYVDLKKGYTLQAIFGLKTNELVLKTTTSFYNHKDRGVQTSDQIDGKKLKEDNGLAFDSWLAVGAASNAHVGLLKSEDKDGSLINKPGLTTADGLTEMQITKPVLFGLDLSFFQDTKNNGLFSTHDGSWAGFGGVQGATDENRILIAQLTTDGHLSFELNIQVGTPNGSYLQFVAKNPGSGQIQSNALVQQ